MHCLVENCILVFSPQNIIRLENFFTHVQKKRTGEFMRSLPKVHLQTAFLGKGVGVIRVPLVDTGQAIISDRWGTYIVTGGRS